MPGPTLTYADAAHLLRRTGFGGSHAECLALSGRFRDEVVDEILDLSGAPADPAPAGVGDPNVGHWDQLVSLWRWWFERMRTSPSPIQERMALFWHNHFATGNDKIDDPALLHEQNHLFRAYGLGSFRTLTHKVIHENAGVILYLDNDPNVQGAPNENLARELMELFTLGVNQGYTQDDVVGSARAWTGHGVVNWDDHRYQFHASRHDTELKTIFGQTRNWDGPELIDFMLGSDPTRKRLAARFISTKVWSWFAHPNPDAGLVSWLENTFYDSDLDVTTLLRAMFNDDRFYATTARQGLVRTPVEYLAAALRCTGLAAGPDDNAHRTMQPEWYMGDMGQELFYPPNVSGWRQNAYWISSAAFWAKADFAENLAWKLTIQGPSPDYVNNFTFLDAVDDRVPVANRPSAADTIQLVADAFGFGERISTTTRQALTTFITDVRRSGPPSWDSWSERRGLIVLALLSPEFQIA